MARPSATRRAAIAACLVLGALLDGALPRLASAHTAHEHEFFDVKGIWVHIESVDCAGGEDMEHQAVAVGGPAWTREFLALVEVAHLFHVTRPTVEYLVGPYVEEAPV
jgi:hypothetical protein